MIRLFLAATFALAVPALAQCDRDLPPQPALPDPVPLERLDRLEYARILEWDGEHLEVKLVLVRQPDGSYVADYEGEIVEKPACAVPVPAEELRALMVELGRMASFPGSSFAIDGAHWRTELSATARLPGAEPLELRLGFWDPSHRTSAAIAGRFHAEVVALVKRLAQARKPARQGLAGALGE